MKNLFTNYAAFYDEASVVPQQSDDKEIRFFAGFVTKANSTVLDIGCAEGKLVAELAKRGHRVTASDIAETFLRQTETSARKNGVTIDTVLFDAEKNIDSFNGECFDTIFLLDVVEHFRNPVAALANIRELLNDNGQLIIHTPNCASPGRIKQYILHPKLRHDNFNPKNLYDFHFQTYDQMTLEKTLNFVGLKVVKMVPTQLSTLGINRLAKVWKKLPCALAKIFPFLADSLLFVCQKCAPVDIEAQIKYWQENKIQS